MAQQFQALKCCFCTTFQVQQVKKSKKWNCKLCAEKQSVLKVYGQGSGADCRKHVQRLNMLQGLKMQAMEATTWPTEEAADSSQDCQPQTASAGNGQIQNHAANRWNVYLDQKPVEETKGGGGGGGGGGDGGDDEIVYTDRQRFQADMKNAGRGRSKRKRGSHFDSEKLRPYGDRSDTNAKETAGMKKKHMNSSMIEGSKWSSDTGEERDNLHQSNSAVQLADKSQSNEDLLPKRTEASKWDKFLPLSNAAVSSGQPAWEQHSVTARLPLPLADEDDEAVSAAPASVLLTADPEPCLSSTTQTAAKIETQPVTTAAVEHVEGASEVMDSSRLCDCTGVSINAGGAGKDCQAQVASTVSVYRAARVSSSLNPGTSLSLLVSTPHQRSAPESPQSAPGLTSKHPCLFVSMFQTDEDLDL